MDPGLLCHFVVPCVAGPPLNPHLFTTPWNPWSILYKNIYNQSNQMREYKTKVGKRGGKIRSWCNIHIITRLKLLSTQNTSFGMWISWLNKEFPYKHIFLCCKVWEDACWIRLRSNGAHNIYTILRGLYFTQAIPLICLLGINII